jgi:hypothetical protein
MRGDEDETIRQSEIGPRPSSSLFLVFVQDVQYDEVYIKCIYSISLNQPHQLTRYVPRTASSVGRLKLSIDQPHQLLPHIIFCCIVT